MYDKWVGLKLGTSFMRDDWSGGFVIKGVKLFNEIDFLNLH